MREQQKSKIEPTQCWSVVAPFFKRGSRNRWIDDFVPEKQWAFRKVPLSADDDWHSRAGRTTGLSRWRRYWEQSASAFPAAGIVTVFPQPALMVAGHKLLRRTDLPLIAWCFNLGEYPWGIKRALARAVFKNVDRFVVHSTGEISRVANFLDIPENRIEFVPLQRAPIRQMARENMEQPFIVSMGSANRDYRTFLEAARISSLPCIIVASPRSLDGLRVPANVSVLRGLAATECHVLVQQSRFSVVPLANPDVASGQVTVIESMRMSRAVIATSSIGTVDYIQNDQTGILVSPNDPYALAQSMVRLWENEALRASLSANADQFAARCLSDEAAGHALARIIAATERAR